MPKRDSDNSNNGMPIGDFVLDKTIFSKVFKKDIRHVYLVKKSERLAMALQLVSPAFRTTPALLEQLDIISITLIQSSIAGTAEAYEDLAQELLSLCSYLNLGKARGLLSSMNADLISHEAQLLVNEIVSYAEPRLFFDDAPTLSELMKQTAESRTTDFVSAPRNEKLLSPFQSTQSERPTPKSAASNKGHIKDISQLSSRQESIIEVLRSKGPSYIKDISTVIREVSEKTIQRELQVLVQNGRVQREGDRRWTRYSLPAGLS